MKNDNRHNPGESTQTFEIGYKLPMDSFEKIYLVTALICFISLLSYSAAKQSPIDIYDILLFGMYSASTGLIISLIRLLFSFRMVITSHRRAEPLFEKSEDDIPGKIIDRFTNTNNDTFRKD